MALSGQRAMRARLMASRDLAVRRGRFAEAARIHEGIAAVSRDVNRTLLQLAALRRRLFACSACAPGRYASGAVSECLACGPGAVTDTLRRPVKALFPQSPIPPSLPVLAQACLWCYGAQMWRVNLPWGVKRMPNPRF